MLYFVYTALIADAFEAFQTLLRYAVVRSNHTVRNLRALSQFCIGHEIAVVAEYLPRKIICISRRRERGDAMSVCVDKELCISICLLPGVHLFTKWGAGGRGCRSSSFNNNAANKVLSWIVAVPLPSFPFVLSFSSLLHLSFMGTRTVPPALISSPTHVWTPKDVILDSPVWRANIIHLEEQIEHFERWVDGFTKSLKQYIDAVKSIFHTRSYQNTQRLIVSHMQNTMYNSAIYAKRHYRRIWMDRSSVSLQ